ncbi:hypothetical protein AYO20_01287 [Fonsecaea nubica]|uniref:Uncharacterized protein n=1 Tax=Fonsecaea nubica TaxID=856822 RepID=A0A178DCN8_9EURO|nr:hypothetical protein AYO20_01287 [Fonsecaea nubica]OAL39417.1 hypothetical protein AYO20_01287 [Fonsecaea nubica]
MSTQGGSKAIAPTLFKGRVGLVTGAGSPYGIGRSIVLRLAEAGAEVIYATDLNLGNISSLEKSVKEINPGCTVEGRKHDVASEEQTVALLKSIVKKHGRFDFYFANAGFADVKNINDLTTRHYERAMNVMATSVFYAIKYGSQAMAVTSPAKPQSAGTIVVTASVAGVSGLFSDLGYSTAKTAAIGLVTQGAVNLSASNIRVNGVAPGAVQTSLIVNAPFAQQEKEFNLVMSESEAKEAFQKYIDVRGVQDQQQYYYNRVAQPDEIADIAVFLGSDLSSAVNGHVVVADSGKTKGALGESYVGPVPPVQPLDLS